MDYISFKKWISPKLTQQYSEYEISSIAAYLAEFYLGKKHTLFSEIIFDENDLLLKLTALQKNQPIQQVVGFAYFGEDKFYIDDHVLIPRPETFELVENIVQECKHLKPVSILDIGTGSGCIAIRLAKYFNHAKVDAIDISAAAIQVAKKNNDHFQTQVSFFEKDIFTWERSEITYDIIVSNPPYIAWSESQTMDKNVLDYEPHEALFSEHDALAFYKKISSFAKNNQSKNGYLFFEIHSLRKNEVMQILSEHEFQHIECHKDFYGNDRIISGKRGESQ